MIIIKEICEKCGYMVPGKQKYKCYTSRCPAWETNPSSGMYRQTCKITKCIRNCPFYRTDMDRMYCLHPYFDNKDFSDRFIITNKEGRVGIPKNCPLRTGRIKITYTL